MTDERVMVNLARSAQSSLSKLYAPISFLSLARHFRRSIARCYQEAFRSAQIRDVFSNDKYKIVNKLGWCVYSTVWLACDMSKSI